MPRPAVIAAAAGCVLIVCTALSRATQPGQPGEMEKYKRDGTYEERMAHTRAVGNHRMSPQLAARAMVKLRALQGLPPPPTRLPRWQGMPTTGTNDMLVFLVEFPDYPHTNSVASMVDKIFGDGPNEDYPYESMRDYYLRSSYGQLTLQGTVVGWHMMQHERSWYTTTYTNKNRAHCEIVKEVVDHYDASHDYSRYDNDGDGLLDYVAIIWAGPDTGPGSFWWGWQWAMYEVDLTRDGVRFFKFSWQWESSPTQDHRPDRSFSPKVLIHETGHILGLPDYYDYDKDINPTVGGIGGMDMMAGNWGDHNAFSKFVLDWITPQVVSSGSREITLRAKGQFPDAAIVMPGYDAADGPNHEYFMVENRTRLNNDIGLPGDGLLIWHVDATPDGKGRDFLYNNATTPHKLLRLMEADGLEEIDQLGRADAGDFYNQGDALTPTSSPNSRNYAGENTYVHVTNISPDGITMTARFTVDAPGGGLKYIRRSATSLSQTIPEGQDGTNQTIEIWIEGGTLSYTIREREGDIPVTPGAGTSSGNRISHSVSFPTATLPPGSHSTTLVVTADGAENSPLVIPMQVIVTRNATIGEAVDAEHLSWQTSAGSPWTWQPTSTHDGEDAAQSGALGDGQTNWIETTVQGPGVVSFWWHVSSEKDYDFVRFSINGVVQEGEFSGEHEWTWEQQTHAVPAGVQTLRWSYEKDVSHSHGADAAWVDQVVYTPVADPPVLAANVAAVAVTVTEGKNAETRAVRIRNAGGGILEYAVSDDAAWLAVSPTNAASTTFENPHILSFDTAGLGTGTHNATITITGAAATNSPLAIPVTLTVDPPVIALGDAVDAPGYSWAVAGDTNWFSQTVTTHDGVDAAQSGDVADDQWCQMETTVTGPGTLSFWWKVSSEHHYDTLSVHIDGGYSEELISGDVDWHQVALGVEPGSHTVLWQYAKDETLSEGDDAGWVDEVVFTAAPPTHYVDMSNATPAAPYTSRATAATTIQDAADEAAAGSTILVAEGVYDVGSRVTPTQDGALACRVVITNAVTVRSVHGAATTHIVGAEATGGGNGTDAVRCIYLAEGAVLEGFTLTNGHTHVKGPSLAEKVNENHRGGGAYGPGALLTHCVITGNGADKDGGGVVGAECRNCLIAGNRSGYNGGGNYGGSMVNCTVAGNQSGYLGGGTYNCSATNSIIYHNTGYNGNHWNAGAGAGVTIYYHHVCTPSILQTGCFDADPRFLDRDAGNYQLAPDSPCINAGDTAFAAGETDLAKAPRIRDTAVDMGAYEDQGTAYWLAVSPESFAIDTSFGASPDDQAITVRNLGAWPLSYVVTSNATWLSATPTGGDNVGEEDTITLSFDTAGLAAGTYTGIVAVVAGQAGNSPREIPVVLSINDTTHYVDVNSTTPQAPYTNWATAATRIQDAVDAATDGARVLVADGVYDQGGDLYLHIGKVTNRVQITKDITVESVNGPAHTFINGAAPTVGGGGDDGVRAVFMSQGTLSGFTIANGHAHHSFYGTYTSLGGGVCSPKSLTPTIRECIIRDNSSSGSGGGTYYGTFERCVIMHNSTGLRGGGSYYGTLHNCLVTDNSAGYGGGTAFSNVRNCTIADNTATNARGLGGGMYQGTAYNTIIYYNTATNSPNLSGNFAGFVHVCTTNSYLRPSMFAVTNKPSFVDRAGGDYHLAYNSPCINTGDNVRAAGTTDLDGNGRIIDGTVDIGAYEYDSSQGPSIPAGWWARYGLADTNTLGGDLDMDGWDNYREYLADTDPDDPMSYFPDANITPSGAGTRVLLVDPSSSIRLYDVLWKTSLFDGTPWQPFGLDILGNGGQLRLPVSSSAPTTYYRTNVRVP